MAYPTGELYVDLRAIADNWRSVNAAVSDGCDCGAVVKANAYGLGVERVAPKIYQAGCRHFFVANLREGVQLRSLVGMDAEIYVLTGCIEGAEKAFLERDVIPVIVSKDMLDRWVKAVGDDERARCVLKVNTGMGRMGLEPEEFFKLLDAPDLLKRAGVYMLMSHLACAENPEHALNARQISWFQKMLEALKQKGLDVKASLANSAGVFLDPSFHYDLVRPGIALYGGNPGLGKNTMSPVVGLKLPVIQVRNLPAGEFVGYGATKSFESSRKIAVVAGGYADGIFRSLSNKGYGWVNGVKVPIVGRISMDSTMFDITEADNASDIKAGSSIELLGEHVSINELADAAGTISYEILTAFGARYQRCYVE